MLYLFYMISKKILLIEDEKDIINLLMHTLSKEKCEVYSITNGDKALETTKSIYPDIVLLDLMLPGIDGLQICKLLKQDPQTSNIPIIILTAKSEETDIVTGLELGAEDYITKPFSPKVLIARIRSVLRRVNKQPLNDDAVLRIGSMTINPTRREVLINNNSIDLTYSEFQTLHFLAKRPGWVFTRYQIVEAVHGIDYDVTDRAVDVLIVSLRKKLGNYADNIETVRGVGYRFKEISS
jgi:two-component system, OmpR family, alkaline phosphatase synthesis response regulator PhoP